MLFLHHGDITVDGLRNAKYHFWAKRVTFQSSIDLAGIVSTGRVTRDLRGTVPEYLVQGTCNCTNKKKRTGANFALVIHPVQYIRVLIVPSLV